MTASAPVQRVEELLAEAGLRPSTPTVTIAGIGFDRFSSILTADRSLDLIVLVDTVEDGPEAKIRQEISGLARALDVAESRRPLTVVLVGPRWSELTERAIARVARVLLCEVVVGDGAEPALRNALSVLLPLTLNASPDEPTESWTEVRRQLEQGTDIDPLGAVLDAASLGADRVHERLVRVLAAPFDKETDDRPDA